MILVDKEYIYETRMDAFIYRVGSAKSGMYYVKIYENKTKKVFSQTLRTSDRIESLARAEIFRENKDKMR